MQVLVKRDEVDELTNGGERRADRIALLLK
jgi:hypothetical protein